MTFEETIAQLRALGSEQTRKTYQRHGSGPNIYGVSFASYGALKKEFVGRRKDKTHAHAVAQQLWATQNIDAQSMATIIADPQQLSESEADSWAQDIHYHALADLFAALVAQTSFAPTKVAQWTAAPDEGHQRIGYSLLSRLAIDNKSMPVTYFEGYLPQMEAAIHQAPNRAKEAINTAFISIGCRSEGLRELAEQAADRIGEIAIDHGDTSCQTFVIRDYLARVWARKTKVAGIK